MENQWYEWCSVWGCMCAGVVCVNRTKGKSNQQNPHSHLHVWRRRESGCRGLNHLCHTEVITTPATNERETRHKDTPTSHHTDRHRWHRPGTSQSECDQSTLLAYTSHINIYDYLPMYNKTHGSDLHNLHEWKVPPSRDHWCCSSGLPKRGGRGEPSHCGWKIGGLS